MIVDFLGFKMLWKGQFQVELIEVEWRIYALATKAIIGSDNGLLPVRREAIIWTNAGILLIWPSWTNFNEMLIEIHAFSFKKMHLTMTSGKGRPFCLGLKYVNSSAPANGMWC